MKPIRWNGFSRKWEKKSRKENGKKNPKKRSWTNGIAMSFLSLSSSFVALNISESISREAKYEKTRNSWPSGMLMHITASRKIALESCVQIVRSKANKNQPTVATKESRTSSFSEKALSKWDSEKRKLFMENAQMRLVDSMHPPDSVRCDAVMEIRRCAVTAKATHTHNGFRFVFSSGIARTGGFRSHRYCHLPKFK